ncbi:uncharacterized protein [Henckelia pumila]|uniref:uncharacterized protein n=1 Tax=Henckelia pumila TaxID=405737 RepID=UPI003C6DE00D
MLRAVVLDFGTNWQESLSLVEFSYNNSYQTSIEMTPFKKLYGRKCRSSLFWDDLSEKPDTGPYMIREIYDKVKLIQSRMKAAQDLQDKYANVRHRPLRFEQGDRIGDLAYRLALPPSLSGIHDVFHVSMLRKCELDVFHVLRPDEAELDDTLSYFKRPMKILDRKEKQLKNKFIPLVKVQWSRHNIEEATWEVEQDMRQRYPELFH